MTRCKSCGKPVCGCSDALYDGVVIIDDRSEPGSWARHIRHTESMRSSHPISPTDDRMTSGGAASNRPASIVGEGR